MVVVRRIDRMVQCQQQGQVARQRGQFRRQPFLLGRADLAAGGHIAVQPDDAGLRREQGPVHIRLHHGRAVGIARFRHLDGLGRTEIAHETVQGLVVRQVVAIVVARHGKHRRQVEFIGLVELLVVFADLAVEVDAVARDIQEGRRLAGVGLEIVLHALGHQFLRHRILDAAHVAIEVEDELALPDDGLVDGGRHDILQVEAERRAARRRRQVAKRRVAGRRLVQRRGSPRLRPRQAKDMGIAARDKIGHDGLLAPACVCAGQTCSVVAQARNAAARGRRFDLHQ